MPPRAKTSVTFAIAAAAFAIGAASTAYAQDYASLYSSTAARNCKKVDAAKNGEGDWTIWSCDGIGGYVVRVSEDDLRMTVSMGRTLDAAANEPAAKRQFAPFNNVHDTLEWRMTKGAPFATIQRWFLSDASNPDKSGKPAQVAMLVITRLNPACHMGYVDVHANAIANALARKTADAQARDFGCSDKPVVIGKAGRATELATP
jgi:carboxypeptidase C (cathepsin A)